VGGRGGWERGKGREVGKGREDGREGEDKLLIYKIGSVTMQVADSKPDNRTHSTAKT